MAARQNEVHELKSRPPTFELLSTGVKRAAVLYNDRDYQAGDLLQLREYSSKSGYTDRVCYLEITFVETEGLAIPEGFAMLSLKTLEKEN